MYKLFLCLLLMFNIFRFAPKETTNSDELNLYSSSVILVEASCKSRRRIKACIAGGRKQISWECDYG